MGRRHPVPIPQPHTLHVCSGVSIQRLTEIIMPISCPDLKNTNIEQVPYVGGPIFICLSLKILHFFNSSASFGNENILKHLEMTDKCSPSIGSGQFVVSSGVGAELMSVGQKPLGQNPLGQNPLGQKPTRT